MEAAGFMQIKEKKAIGSLKNNYDILILTVIFLHITLITGFGIVEAKEREKEGLHPNTVNKRYTGHKISLDFKDVNIREVFTILQAISGKKIIVAKNVTGRVTLSINNIPWDKVLDQIVSSHGLKMIKKENAILISSIGKSKKTGLKRKPEKLADNLTTSKVKQKSKYFQHQSFPGNRGLYGVFLCEYVFQGINVQQTKDKFTSEVEINFNNSTGFQLRGGYTYNEYISYEGIFEYLASFNGDIGVGIENNLDVMNITMGLKGSLPVSERFRPYSFFGLSALNAYETLSFNSEISKTSDWGPAYRGSLGLNMAISSSVSTMFELAYIIGSGSVSHIKYTTLGLGLVYHFQ